MPPAELDVVFREEYGRILATLIRWSRNFEDAEEVVQDAFAAAALHWHSEGIPANTGAWILTTAKNRLVDRRRVEKRRRELLNQYGSRELIVDSREETDLPDDSLRLVFTCCHPALGAEGQIALTLRTLGGLSTEEIARAFIVPAPTMAQRLVRVKRKITQAGIPYQLPDTSDMAERLESVLRVIYLIFNEGYSATAGDELIRPGLCGEALRLAALLDQWLPGEAEVEGLRALMILNHSRREARVRDGLLVTLDLQDRGLWKRSEIEVGIRLVEGALGRKKLGPYQVQAAIAAVHAEAQAANQTDWPQIVRLYCELLRFDPNPVVLLNHGVAIGYAFGWQAGLECLERIDGLQDYYPFYAARAQMLKRLGRQAEAFAAFGRAIALTSNQVEREYLSRQMQTS